MGLLDKLWDDTLAGPRPDSGLSRLRKYSSLSPRSASGKGFGFGGGAAEGGEGGSGTLYEEAAGVPAEPVVKVTRSITIKRPAGYASPPVSPAASSPTLLSPLSGGGRGANWFRRKSSDAYERPSAETGSGSAPSAHDVRDLSIHDDGREIGK